VGAHHHREYVDALLGEGVAGAVLDALALGNDPLLARRDDVSPVGVHACEESEIRMSSVRFQNVSVLLINGSTEGFE